ncbi:uncharacterized protein LOC133869713 [Alnus glutinosa]|uniref:uncharacterized protein LOC133869713 n=1 Tax=Alnus glutinosa TaxID=3517 RepID=UPI002D770E88|nr:uncharacterized protein LOC133869713 [Alnus glutinosa]
MPKPKFKETNQTMEVSEVKGPVSDPKTVVSAKCLQCLTVAHGSSHRLETTSAAVSGVVLGLSTSGGDSTSSRFVFPPLLSPKMLSSAALDAPPALDIGIWMQKQKQTEEEHSEKFQELQ